MTYQFNVVNNEGGYTYLSELMKIKGYADLVSFERNYKIFVSVNSTGNALFSCERIEKKCPTCFGSGKVRS